MPPEPAESMDFDYSEEQEAVREASAAIFAGHATPERVATVEVAEPVVDRDLLAELARANLLGLTVPERFGGAGLGMLEACALLVEQGRRVAPIPLLATLVGSLAVAAFGTSEQAVALLRWIAAGDATLAIALPVPGDEVPVRANRSGERWRLEGTYPLVRSATVARFILVAARDESGVPHLFALERETDGCTVVRLVTTDRQEHGRVILDGAEVPESLRLGAGRGGAESPGELGGAGKSSPGFPGDGIVTWITERYITALCAICLGVCQEAVSLAARYVTERHQFGKPLAAFQGVALRAADAHIDTEAMSVTLWQAAWKLDRLGEAPADVAVAKWWASEAGNRVVHAVQHLHGGLGADVTYPVHRYFLWAKQIGLEMGAGPLQLAFLGDELVSVR